MLCYIMLFNLSHKTKNKAGIEFTMEVFKQLDFFFNFEQLTSIYCKIDFYNGDQRAVFYRNIFRNRVTLFYMKIKTVTSLD